MVYTVILKYDNAYKLRVQGSAGCRVQGAGFGVWSSEFRVQGSGIRVQGSGFRV
jgi:hypothetical protein